MSNATCLALGVLTPTPGHPLAAVAARHCSHSHSRRTVACKACWEHVIAVDAEFAAECELPAEPPVPDPGLIDSVAVDLACRGERYVSLNPAERGAAMRRLMAAGMSRWAAERRVGGWGLSKTPVSIGTAVAA